MATNYDTWCTKNTDIKPLIRAMKSSMPEQYIGYYLELALGNGELEYQRTFDWLGNSSLDIYIPSLQFAIEYDGIYFHSNQKRFDASKTSICHSHGIYVIRILEQNSEQPKSRKHNEISYYFEKKYTNIDVVIYEIVNKINKKFGLAIKCDVNIDRDKKEIISYVQNKFYKRSVAYVWPESIDYWDETANSVSAFDVLHTSNFCYELKCPHCGRNFTFHMRYFHNRKSLIPCSCEYKKIEKAFEEAIKNYQETGIIYNFDGSLFSRRLYDRMASIACNIWRCRSKEEAEMYKKIGFDPKYIDVYLSLN